MSKNLVPVGPAFRGWEITSLIPGYLAASPVVCGAFQALPCLAALMQLKAYLYLLSTGIPLFFSGHKKTAQRRLWKSRIRLYMALMASQMKRAAAPRRTSVSSRFTRSNSIAVSMQTAMPKQKATPAWRQSKRNSKQSTAISIRPTPKKRAGISFMNLVIYVEPYGL